MKQIAQLFGSMVAMGFDTSNFAVVGGCLRDRMLDPLAAPKDIDVCIVQHARGVFNEVMLPAGWYVDAEFDSDYGGEAKSEDFDKRIENVLKLRWLDPEAKPFDAQLPLQVDLIFAKERFGSVFKFVREFDFNLNQWMLPALAIICQADFHPVFVGDERGKLLETRGTEVDPHRRARMIRLAHQYGWDISDFQGELL
jgi:hypothetical protein